MSNPPSERVATDPTGCNGQARGLARSLWSAAGTFFLAIGVVGVAVPILPTTPFLLLAAVCYLRGSKRMYDWMMSNRAFGKYLCDYREGRGIPLRVKVGTIAFLWIAISTSAVFFTDEPWLRAVLFVVAIAVSIHVATIKQKKRGNERLL
ncbi:MAG: YbaN family protein [Candidatus Thermoplasmatota archaeon]|nr:YbaN family protein [Candidatus Thermoplasmatota archaeon]